MKWPCFILFVLGFNIAFGQFNNMSADLIMKRDVSWIKASYFEDDMSPNYQVFYAFDTIGRPVHSNSSDETGLEMWIGKVRTL